MLNLQESWHPCSERGWQAHQGHTRRYFHLHLHPPKFPTMRNICRMPYTARILRSCLFRELCRILPGVASRAGTLQQGLGAGPRQVQSIYTRIQQAYQTSRHAASLKVSPRRSDWLSWLQARGSVTSGSREAWRCRQTPTAHNLHAFCNLGIAWTAI